jgi:FkbM family methyltransferase
MVKSHLSLERDQDMTRQRRTFVIPGSFLYYAIFGVYLFCLGIISLSSSKPRQKSLVEKLGWTDQSAFLSWLFRRLGLPRSSFIAFESYLLGTPGVIEPAIGRFLKLKKGRLFVDVGAYHGHYSILLSNGFSQVMSVEPVPGNVAFFENVLKYRRIHNITIINKAIDKKAGVASFQIMPQLSESKLSSEPLPNGQAIKVPTSTLDSLLDSFGQIDLVKLDVEGRELEVLAGATKIMSRVKSWLIEMHDPSFKQRLESSLLEHNLRLCWVDQGHLYAYRPEEASTTN